MKYRVEFHWACIEEGEDYQEAIDTAMLLFSDDYKIDEADWIALRSGMRATVVVKE